MQASTVADDASRRLPKFLESFENLIGHFDEHFGPLGSNERGETFLDLANKVIELTDEGQDFPALRPSQKKSHDGGVDLFTAETSDSRVLCAQSKYKIRSKDEFDSIISKFKNYELHQSPRLCRADTILLRSRIPRGSSKYHFCYSHFIEA